MVGDLLPLTNKTRERENSNQPIMDEKDQTKEQRIEELRELQKPTTFDAWLCLGGDYRDLAEAQEWASRREIDKLSLDYTVFREKMEHNLTSTECAAISVWFRHACQQVGEDKKQQD